MLAELRAIRDLLASIPAPLRRDVHAAAHSALRSLRDEALPVKQVLVQWKGEQEVVNRARYGSHLYSGRALQVRRSSPFTRMVPYSSTVLRSSMLPLIRSSQRDPRVIAFGEDVGKLGDVNQGFKGLQEKYGEWRVTDTGIREATILGQAIGMSMRGLRPICEIQYLDYLLYAIQIMSDDLATLHWRTAGGQSAPVIVRTRGHRLEGIWHSGSLMAGPAGSLAGNVRPGAARHDTRRRLLQHPPEGGRASRGH